MKDVTAFISKSKGVFFVDSEDIDTGDAVGIPGETVQFTYRLKIYTASVSDRAHGRDDDVLELNLL